MSLKNQLLHETLDTSVPILGWLLNLPEMGPAMRDTVKEEEALVGKIKQMSERLLLIRGEALQMALDDWTQAEIRRARSDG